MYVRDGWRCDNQDSVRFTFASSNCFPCKSLDCKIGSGSGLNEEDSRCEGCGIYSSAISRFKIQDSRFKIQDSRCEGCGIHSSAISALILLVSSCDLELGLGLGLAVGFDS